MNIKPTTHKGGTESNSPKTHKGGTEGNISPKTHVDDDIELQVWSHKGPSDKITGQRRRTEGPKTHEDDVEFDVLTHKGSGDLLRQKIGKEALKVLPHTKNKLEVLNHQSLQVAEDLANGQLPKVKNHLDAQQKPISTRNPFRRFPDPPVDLELDKRYLGVPILNFKEKYTKEGVIENRSPQLFYRFVLWLFGKPGGFSEDEYIAISLTRMALLHEHKDKIIELCSDPYFSPSQVADYIVTKTGILLDVEPDDPRDTIRLVEDGLRAGQMLLEGIPEDPDKTIDAVNIKNAFQTIFPRGNIKFHEQVTQMREAAFKNKYQTEDVDALIEREALVIPEGNYVPVFKPKSNLTNDRDFLVGALMAYKRNQPEDTSASAFKKHLSQSGWLQEYSKTRERIPEEEIDEFIHESIMDCVLGSYVPIFHNDRKDRDEDVLVEELEVYFLNTPRDDKDEYRTADAFRNYMLKMHPFMQDYKIEKFLREAIDLGWLGPYKPRYDAKMDIKEILDEELRAYKLNIAENMLAVRREMRDVEQYLKDERDIFTVQGMKEGQDQAVAITQEDLSLFLTEYVRSELKPNYVPKYDNKTYIQKILNEELDAYRHNKPRNADANYDSKASFEKYLRDERRILNVMGMTESSDNPQYITEGDLTAFLNKLP